MATAATAETPAHGLAYKLLLSPSGTKFGKSEGGESVWLDPARTSPYAFYQYWLNTDDRDVGTYLRWFTELSRARDRGARGGGGTRTPRRGPAQRALARDITARTHGAAAAEQAIADSAAQFSADAVDDPAVARVAVRVGRRVHVRSGVAGGRDRRRCWPRPALFASRGEARRMIAGGGVTVNGERVTDPAAVPEPIAGEWLDVRIGKRRREIGRPRGLTGRRLVRASGQRWRACRTSMTSAGGEVALGEQHERVVEEVGRLAGERLAGRCRSAPDASAAASSLAAMRTSVASSVTLRPAASTPPSSSDVGVGAGRSLAARVGDRRPQRLEPGEALASTRSAGAPSGSKQLRVPRWQVGPTGSARDQERVAVAVDREVDEPQDVAARLALAPEPVARARVEMDLAGRERGRERLGVHPGEHQHAPSATSWTTAGTRPSGAERGPSRDRRRDRRHATACRDEPDRQPGGGHRGLDVGDRVDPAMEDRGGEDRVGAAVADRGHEVGRTGGAAGRDDRHADPRRDRAQQRGVEAGAGPVAVDRGHQQLAGAELDGALGPGDGVEPGRLAAALDDDLPGGSARSAAVGARVDRDDDRLPAEARRAAADRASGRRRPRC